MTGFNIKVFSARVLASFVIVIWKTHGISFSHVLYLLFTGKSRDFVDTLMMLFCMKNHLHLCFKLLSSLNMNDSAKMAITIWSIWNRKNAKFWDDSNASSKYVNFRANCYSRDWLHAKNSFPHLSGNLPCPFSEVISWPPPPMVPSSATLTSLSLRKITKLVFTFVFAMIQVLVLLPAHHGYPTSPILLKVKLPACCLP